MAKDSNYEFTKKNRPNFKAFIEDLADELTFGVKANHDPPMHLDQEKSTIDWSKGEMAYLKCASSARSKSSNRKDHYSLWIVV